MATWNLDPTVAHLNHGSFGACPTEVLEAQNHWRSAMEINPVTFMLDTYQPALEASRAALSDFVRADTDGLVFVPNATFGVNSVLRSLEGRLSAGTEIVLTNHTYNAVRNAAEVTAERTSAKVIVVDVPFPIESAQEVVDALVRVVTERTALVIIDHVTSPTAMIMPVEAIVAQLEPDVPVLVDGAHAPGMLPVDLGALGASFYTANCHKWMCAPKGAAFLHVAERHRDDIASVVISHGHNDGWPGSRSRFHARFDWTGTDDPSARLSVGSAIEVMEAHRADGWPGIRESNHRLALEGRRIVAEALDVDLPVPDHLIGSIASIPLPPPKTGSDNIFDPLMAELRQRWSIEVPVFVWPEAPDRFVRISAQQYNTESDYERLAHALETELRPRDL